MASLVAVSRPAGSIAGTAAALQKQSRALGLLWVDAHADMNTPESTASGNVHGMPLAAVLGKGPPELVEVGRDEIVSALARHSDNGFRATHAPSRPGEVQEIYLDTSRAREELGWEARVDLDEGLELTLASLR